MTMDNANRVSETFIQSWYKAFSVTHNWTQKRSRRLLNYYLQYVSNFKLENSTVLDIGGGSGLLSFICAELGSKVTCIDPLSDGSNSNMLKLRQIILQGCRDKQIEFLPSSFQDFVESNKFDVIFMHNSVNHLDEYACLNLKESDMARLKYITIFQKISRISKNNGLLILSDCSNRNLFGDLGFVNPFAPTINWQLHQDPETWIKIIKNCNLEFIEVRWSSPQIIGWLGKKFLRNKRFAYLTTSHFTIVFRSK